MRHEIDGFSHPHYKKSAIILPNRREIMQYFSPDLSPLVTYKHLDFDCKSLPANTPVPAVNKDNDHDEVS